MAAVQMKVSYAGNSMCLMLNKEAQAMLDVAKGDTVTLIKDSEGHFTLVRNDTDYQEQMDIAKQVMLEWRDGLRELAKK